MCLQGSYALAPWLQLRTGLPDNLVATQALLAAVTLPLSLYLLPRFVLMLDAQTLDTPLNPKTGWPETFETRWFGMLGGKVLLLSGVFLGAFALLIPGLMLLAAFGWAPTLMLLRGFDLRKAFRGSLRIMGRHGAKVLFVAMGAFLIFVLVSLAASSLLPVEDAALSPLFRYKSPRMWLVNATSILLSLWLGATLLALFHQVEGPALEPESEPEEEDD